MPDAIFERQGDLYMPTEAALGPWSPNALHGGPPAMLIAREVEALPSDVPMMVARMTVELMRPVPLAPLSVRAELIRAGRRVQLVGATLLSGGTELARATAVRIRQGTLDVPAEAVQLPPLLAASEIVDFSKSDWDLAGRWPSYGSLGVEMRQVAGAVTKPGPATIWVRLKLPVIAGEEPSPFMRVAAAADFGNGVSWVLEPTRYLFINPDLTINLFRLPEGEWVCLDATTHVQPEGIGLATGVLYDQQGLIGHSLQSLLLDAR